MSNFIDLNSSLVPVSGDFGRFWGSDGLPGSSVGALGLPWGPNVTPKRLQRGSGRDLGSILESPGNPRRDIFQQKLRLFSGLVLDGLLGPLFK